MHSNNAVRHKKNKHGRKGVRKAVPVAPEAREEAFSLGYKAGVGAGGQWALDHALTAVKQARTVAAARKAIQALVDAHEA